MEEFIPFVALTSMVVAFINFLKYARAGDVNAALTQVSVWLAGVVALLIAAETAFADTIAFGGVSLDDANFWTKVFVGLTFASFGSVVTDFKKASDNTDSAATPPLITDSSSTRTVMVPKVD